MSLNADRNGMTRVKVWDRGRFSDEDIERFADPEHYLAGEDAPMCRMANEVRALRAALRGRDG